MKTQHAQTMNTPTPCACLICRAGELDRLRGVASAYSISGHTLGEIAAHAGRAYPTRREIWDAAPGYSEGVQRAALGRSILRGLAVAR